MASVCVVSSLHDGMNLAAKGFIAARDDLRDVLVLSRFTGAPEELADALLINPYAADKFTEALRLALTMPEEELERRMRHLRQQVVDNNIYRWAGMLLSEAGKLVEASPRRSQRPRSTTSAARQISSHRSNNGRKEMPHESAHSSHITQSGTE